MQLAEGKQSLAREGSTSERRTRTRAARNAFEEVLASEPASEATSSTTIHSARYSCTATCTRTTRC